MTNVIELAKQAGFSGSVAKMWEAHFTELVTLVRNAALEEAAQYCHDASIPQPDQIHTDAQWAAACLAVNLRNLKEPTP